MRALAYLAVSLLGLAGIVADAPFAEAGVSKWTSSWIFTPAPPRTVVSAAFAKGGSTQLYLAAHGRGLYASPDGGATWNVQESGPPDAESVMAAPGDPSVAYATEIGGEIYHTQDSGVTWQSAGMPGGGASVIGGSPVVVDPTDPNVAYARVFVDGGIERTTNGGSSWSPVTLPDTSGVLSLAVDPSGTSVYAGTQGSLYKAPVSGGSWTTVSTALGCAVLAIAFDRANPSVIYAGGADCSSPGTPGTIWRSTDAGAHFSAVAAVPGLAQFRSIAVDASGQHVVAVGFAGSGGVFYSSDGGLTFTPVLVPPDPESEPASVAAVDGTSETFLMGTHDGVAESDDGGQTWHLANFGLETFPAFSLATSPVNAAAVYAGSWDLGVGASANNGESWPHSGRPPWDVQSIATDINGSTLYAGTGNGLWVSTDSGGHWIKSTQLDSGVVIALAADQSQPGTVYAAVQGATIASGGLWRSVDFGSGWQRIDAGLPSHAFTALAISTNPHQVYVAIDGAGVAESSAENFAWSPFRASPDVDALTVDPSGNVYAGACTATGGIVFRSVDGGLLWARQDAGLASTCVTGLAAEPNVPGLIYASTLGSGVYVSNDVGASWSPLNTGLVDGNLNAIALNRDGTYAHVAGRKGVDDYQFSADIWSDVQATPLTLTPGQQITLKATFGNDGPDDATSVTGTFTLPGDASAPALADTADGIYCTGGHVDICTASILPAGTSFEVTLRLQAGGPGSYTSSADVSGVRFDPMPRDTSASTAITVGQPPKTPARDSTPPTNLRFTGVNGPVSPLTQRFQRTNSVALGWAAYDLGGTSTYDVRVRTATPAGTFGGYAKWRSGTTRTSGTYRGSPGSTVCFGLRARDAAGNTSAWTADVCTAFPLSTSSLIHRNVWHRLLETRTPFAATLATTTQGATLRLDRVHAQHLALFVDRCPGCGILQVSLGGRRFATINLNATRTKRATLVLLAPTRLHGSLEITVVTSERPVRIAAIGLNAART